MWLRKQSRKLYSTLPYKSWLNEVIILDWNRLLCKFEGIKSNNGYKFHSSYDSTPSIPDGTFGTSFYRCAGRRIAHCGPGLESSSQCVPSRRVAPQRKNDEHIGHNADESIIYSIRCINIYIYSVCIWALWAQKQSGSILTTVECCLWYLANIDGRTVGEKCTTSQTRLWPRAEENDEQIALTSWCYTNLKYTNNTGCFNPTVPISPRFTVDSFCPVVYIDSEFKTNKNTCSPCILAFCSHVMWYNWDILNIKKLDQWVTSHRGENASAGQALTKSY